MQRHLLLYALTVPVFFIIDIVWIGLVARGLYQREIGSLLLVSPRWAIAVAFYLLYVVGILVLAVLPGHASGSLFEAVWKGALLGHVAYATYDLTNLATLKGWSTTVAIVDMVWGAVLTGVVAGASYVLAGWVKV